MGVEWLNGGMRIGDLALDTTDAATNGYFGGQPAQIGANGLKLAKAANDQTFVGVFQNSSFEDLQNGSATLLTGVCYLRFINGSVSQDSPTPTGQVVEGAPYNTSLTFNPGDKIYIDANGLWTNVANAGTEKGIVTKGNTGSDDAVEVILFPSNLRATA
jgi:hypothetical protein